MGHGGFRTAIHSPLTVHLDRVDTRGWSVYHWVHGMRFQRDVTLSPVPFSAHADIAHAYDVQIRALLVEC